MFNAFECAGFATVVPALAGWGSLSFIHDNWIGNNYLSLWVSTLDASIVVADATKIPWISHAWLASPGRPIVYRRDYGKSQP